MALNIRYLWIDSLCIVQNSVEDWMEESSLMGSIYKHAFCTIASSWGTNDERGCFVDRAPLQVQLYAGTVKGLPSPSTFQSLPSKISKRRARLLHRQDNLKRVEAKLNYHDIPPGSLDSAFSSDLAPEEGKADKFILPVQNFEPNLWQ